MLYLVCISFNICIATSGLESRLQALITELIALMLTKPRCLLSDLFAVARLYFKSIPYRSIRFSASSHWSDFEQAITAYLKGNEESTFQLRINHTNGMDLEPTKLTLSARVGIMPGPLAPQTTSDE